MSLIKHWKYLDNGYQILFLHFQNDWLHFIEIMNLKIVGHHCGTPKCGNFKRGFRKLEEVCHFDVVPLGPPNML